VKRIDKIWWSTLIFTALLIPAFLLAVSEGSEAPSVMFRTLENEMVFSRDYVGEPRILKPDEPRVNLLLVFFRTSDNQFGEWMPMLLSELQRLNASKFKVFLISVDESIEDIRTFQKQRKPQIPVLLDKFGAACELFGMNDISAFNRAPAAVMIDRSGDILYYNQRFSSSDISDLLMKTASLY
jgi:peroxiredoxin